MKSVKQLTKRAFSPINTKAIETSDRKKKSNSNYPNNPYRQSKEFDSFANKDKKRNSNYLKEILKQSEPVNKYRIVTEPVDDRMMTIVTSSFIPSRSKGKLEHEQSGSKIRHISQEKRGNEHYCMNCQRYLQELNAVKSELNRIFMSKIMWKSGQLPLTALKDQYGLNGGKVTKSKGSSTFKPTQSILHQAKKHFYDLMRDIESLSEIDYPKMLALKIFKYQRAFDTPKLKDEDQIKSLLAQLRNQNEGKVTSWDLEDQTQESDHIKAIVRNLRSRLSFYMRQNLELKAKKAIIDRAEDMSLESEQYLRQIIEDVLSTYAKKS